jgi:hypothetical protein
VPITARARRLPAEILTVAREQRHDLTSPALASAAALSDRCSAAPPSARCAASTPVPAEDRSATRRGASSRRPTSPMRHGRRSRRRSRSRAAGRRAWCSCT